MITYNKEKSQDIGKAKQLRKDLQEAETSLKDLRAVLPRICL